ncbi:MAG: potassium/proton antiporter [Verrucomicrobia bacterium]|jgi:cell volume regulation protein A|nr:potassium/proton antiporter [Verrucomicrobiota bacterium]OQC67669.1 MAG: K(+)/H(+) antiporter NhaP [Verrucomicrobia bacterium ADurb.Bin006]NMD20735.1 potassium/proton antiporter [Verrucomicrobiota bacterium]HNU99285.1 potassium/proton antiporter [Verrucomicrobiota bacterium]HOA61817.1 potassium/proton antiporter [Verrucomicrobiota bacterium]
MFLIDTLILVTGVLLLLGLASSKLAARLGMPVLVLFLLVGMIAGSEGIGGLDFEDYRLAHGIGTVALAVILFDGGLGTSLAAIRLSWKPSILLATVGVLVTAVITGVAASWVLDISLMEGLLLGSIVGSTDASAVFVILRWGGVSLAKRIAAVLEVESASNDPMAIFLTIGCIEVLLGHVTIGPSLLGLFASQMAIGAIWGVAGGYATAWLVNRIELGAAGMYPVLVSACCLLIFGAAAQLGGSGFLAVYLAGVVIGNRRLAFQRSIRRFHDALAWMGQIVMFVTLGLLCFPSRLWDVGGKAILICIVLMCVARPVAVLISAMPFCFTERELGFMSWVGLKGAVPITLATFPLMLATPENSLQAPLIFDVVFFIVVLSAIVQGTSLNPAARWLGLERPRDPEPPVTLEISSLRHVDGEVVDYAIGEDSRAAGRMVKDLALPGGVVIALIARGDRVIPPQGITRIHTGDHVILVLRPGTQPLVNQVFGRISDKPAMVPKAIEFPFRGSTTVGEFEEFYSIHIDAPPKTTLDEAMRRELGPEQTALDAVVVFGPLRFRIQRLSETGRIELVGMAILPKSEDTESEAERSEDGIG